MIDVLVTQHSKWIAGRIRGALFGQTTSSEVASTDHDWQKELAQKPVTNATSFKSSSVGKKPQSTCGQRAVTRRVATWRVDPRVRTEETANVGNNVGQNGEVFFPPFSGSCVYQLRAQGQGFSLKFWGIWFLVTL